MNERKLSWRKSGLMSRKCLRFNETNRVRIRVDVRDILDRNK